MKKFLMITGAICAASAAWLYNDLSEPRAVQPAPAPALPAARTAASEFVAEMFVGGAETPPVVGVRKDRGCRVELRDYVTTDGEMFAAYSCTPLEPPSEHPYARYTDEALEALAYGDAEAAARLGQRLAGENPEKAYQLLIRATALDGDPRHLAWLADAFYSRYRVDGQLQIDNVMRQYEIAALSTRFGEDPGTPEILRDELIDAGIGSDQIERLDDRVERLLDQIRDIQVSVFGEIRHGGRGDA